MKREDFEHVLWAAIKIVEDEIIVVGSQAVLADHPDAPAELLVSMEVDLYPRSQPERAIEIDGAIGDGSQFFVTYGYYAHGVGPETVAAPAGWERRTTRLEFGASGKKVAAYCMSTTDRLWPSSLPGEPDMTSLGSRPPYATALSTSRPSGLASPCCPSRPPGIRIETRGLSPPRASRASLPG